MTRVFGPLRVVTDRPLLVSGVRVRAARDRAERGGLTAAFDDSVPVVDGRLDMTVLPGPAVLVLEVMGGFSHAVKLVVPDVAEATLEQCVTAGEVAGEADRRTLERLAGEVERNTRVASEAAERAATIAGSTRWVGTRLEVNGELSPDLKGERGETGTRGLQGPPGDAQQITDLGDKEHLDNITRTGVYHQGWYLNAKVENGYPAQLGGLLEVHNPHEYFAYQRYTVYQSRDMYYRGRYLDEWGPWRKITTGSLTWEEITGKPDVATRQDVNSALGTARAYTDALIVVGDTGAADGKLHIVYE